VAKELNMNIEFSQIIKQKIPGLKLGLIEARNVEIRKKSELVSKQYSELETFIQNKFAENPPSSDAVVSAVRRMYRKIGWEPTKYRPSSEAMIRRFLKDKGLYHINNFVDLGNVASTKYHLPMGLYDLDKIEGDIIVDVGREDESYQGISKELIHASGKLILRDDVGIFGNPTADSKRTCLGEKTKNVLVLFFTPPELDNEYLNETLNYLNNLYKTECPAIQRNTKIIS
jgi:DNA/RNA-binding domain of Phe-tRNA-synthetase-like protein